MSINAEYAVAASTFEARARAILRPDDGEDIVSWLEANVKSIPYSPTPGPFRSGSTPWIIEPLRAMADPEVRQVCLLACVQASKSQAIELLTAYILARDPGPTLALQASDAEAKDWTLGRLHPLWSKTEAVGRRAGVITDAMHTDIRMPHMQMWCRGAMNEKNLQRISIRWLLMDEPWQYPTGHIAQAKARVTAFGAFGKVIMSAQGGEDGDDWHREWKTTTQETWGFACPECDHEQVFAWESIVYPERAKLPDGTYDRRELVRLTYKCSGCGHHFPDSNESRRRMNERGRYIVTNPNADARNRGFSWNALAVRSWYDLALKMIAAKEEFNSSGDNTARKIVMQKELAKFWVEEADESPFNFSPGGYNMSDPWPEEAGVYDKGLVGEMAPGRIPLRIVTVDCQRAGFWAMCRSWSRSGKSRLRGWAYLRTREEVEQFVDKHGVHRQFVFLDAGDSDDEFWIWLARKNWRALRGDQRKEFKWDVRDRSNRLVQVFRPISAEIRYGASGVHKVPVYFFSTLILKDMLTRLRKTSAWTEADDCGRELLEQMESEKVGKNGRGEREWQLIGRRANHLWDCATMQLFAPLYLGVIGAKRDDEGMERQVDAEDGSEG